MIITYHGGESVKVTAGDTTLAFNPVSKNSKLKSTSFGSDIVLSTLNHPDTNGLEEASRGDKKPFYVTGPGEYEVASVVVVGEGAKSEYGGTELINTVYTVKFDGMTIVYLGALLGAAPRELTEELESVDVLFLPIGGEGVLTAAEAQKVAVSLEPKIIIPIHWDGIGEKDALKKYLKEASSDAKPIDKLTIRRKDVEGKQGEVVVIQS